MKGVVTTAGSGFFSQTHQPAEKDAACLAIARRRKVQIVGKTNMTEFAISPSGMNEYFGTPVNPLKRSLIPGGSSSGNAVAVATGMADVAFGTDTAGSIRVPAACCGVVGLKTTYGLIPIEGVYPVEPRHLDTVGPMGKDIDHTVQGMDLLQDGFAAKYAAAKAAKPTAGSIRVGRLKLKGTDPKIDQAIDDALAKTGFQVVELDASLSDKFEQAKKDGNTVAAAGAWISDGRFQFSLGVAARTKTVIQFGQITYATGYRSALARRSAWQRTLSKVFEKVDLIALPTLQKTPPEKPLLNLRIGIMEAHLLQVQNTVAVNFAGNPALAIPVPMRHGKVPSESAIDRTATGRGGSAQCRKAGRGRGKKISDELGQSLRRCEIGVGKIHVLVDARAIEFRHTVFSRPMHGQTGWNRMVLFITRDSSDINAADEFA